MRRDDVGRIAAKGRLAGELLERDGLMLLRYAAEFAKGYPTTSDGPSGRGGVSDPTSGQALIPEPFQYDGATFDAWLARFYDASTAIVHLAKLLTPLDQDQLRLELGAPAGRENTVPVCCEPHCEDPADPGREGRCEPCYRWRYRYRVDHQGDSPPIVPRAVIAERIAERDRRRQKAS